MLMKKGLIYCLVGLGIAGAASTSYFIGKNSANNQNDAAKKAALEELVIINSSNLGNIDFERFQEVVKNAAEANYKNVKIGGETKSEDEMKATIVEAARRYGLQIPGAAPLQNQFEALQKHIECAGQNGSVLLVYQDKNSAGNRITEVVLGKNAEHPVETDYLSVFDDAIQQLNLKLRPTEPFKVYTIDILVDDYSHWENNSSIEIGRGLHDIYLSNQDLMKAAQSQLEIFGLKLKSLKQMIPSELSLKEKDQIFREGLMPEAMLWREYSALIDAGDISRAVLNQKDVIKEFYIMNRAGITFVAVHSLAKNVELTPAENKMLAQQAKFLKILQTKHKYALLRVMSDYRQIIEVGEPMIEYMDLNRNNFAKPIVIMPNSTFGDKLKQVENLSPKEIDKMMIDLYKHSEEKFNKLQ